MRAYCDDAVAVGPSQRGPRFLMGRQQISRVDDVLAACILDE